MHNVQKHITPIGNYEVPTGWPMKPYKRPYGGTPGPPVMYEKPSDPEEEGAGYGYSNAEHIQEKDVFFYHSDHLGSTSYITDKDGNATQFVSYKPYGEALVDEHATSYEMPWKFNGKELDSETGLYYYSARYYEPVLALWYGVDAMAEKYNSTSPYSYCFANPIRLIDPDGNGPLDRVKYARSYCGIQYKQETSTALRTEKTKDALEFMDCSELVCRVLADDGITDGVKHMASSTLEKFLSDKTKFEHSDIAKVGDIAVWEGHVGIVSEVDSDKIKLIHARGKTKTSNENSIPILPSQYRNSKFLGYYRPIDNTEENDKVYNAGLLPEVVIKGEMTHKKEPQKPIVCTE